VVPRILPYYVGVETMGTYYGPEGLKGPKRGPKGGPKRGVLRAPPSLWGSYSRKSAVLGFMVHVPLLGMVQNDPFSGPSDLEVLRI